MKKGLKYNFLAVIILLQATILSLSIATSNQPIKAENTAENQEKSTIAVADVIDTPIDVKQKEEPVVAEPVKKEETKPVAKQPAKQQTTKPKAEQPAKQPTEPVKQEQPQQPQPVTNVKGVEVGSISISNSNFKKDLVKDDTTYYFLNNSLSGVYDQIGVPFIDFRNDFNGRKTIIYAHSSKTLNAPFNYLQNYHNNKGFFDAHRYIYINYGGRNYTYEIFSVYISIAESDYDDGLEYYNVMKYSNENWERRIQEYKSYSEYDTGVQVSGNDKILILQTCSMDNNVYQKHYRANQLIMAKLIN